MATKSDSTNEDGGFSISKILVDIFTSPLNLMLVSIIALLVYKIFKRQQATTEIIEHVPDLPKLKKRDFTLEELKPYNGTNEEGRVLVAVNGKVFDVTKGRKFYGPGGPYAAFGGRDASRGLATFSVTQGKDEYDDLSDLNSVEMESVREWEMQFTEKYEYVGRLLKPGQEPASYSDEEEEEVSQQENTEKSKDD